MDKSPKPFLKHILEAIDEISGFIEGYDFEQFQQDRKTKDAVIRQLEIIGEATTHLEQDFRNKYKKIPWRDISDFRNVLAHEYWDIDDKMVWLVAKKEIVDLKSAIRLIIDELR